MPSSLTRADLDQAPPRQLPGADGERDEIAGDADDRE